MLAEAAKALLDAESPVVVVEGLGESPGGSEVLQSLIELLGIPVLEQGSAFNLANRHPLNLTGANVEVLKEADLVLAVGVKDIEAALKRPVPEAGSVPSGQPRVSAGYGRRYESLIPAGAQLMRIGLEDYGVKSWASSYGRLCPTAFPILGDGVQVLRELRRLCADAMDGGVQRRGSQVSAGQAAPHRHVRPHPAGSQGPLVGAEADLDRQASRRDLGGHQGRGLGPGARLVERLGAAAVGGHGQGRAGSLAAGNRDGHGRGARRGPGVQGHGQGVCQHPE